MAVRTWGVLGTGPLGRGIAELAAAKGFEVIIWGAAAADLDQARRIIDLALQQQIERWAITESEKRATLGRIRFTTDLAQLTGAQFVVDASSSSVKEIQERFRQLDELCDSDVIFSVATSTVSVTEIAAATQRPEKVIGCHFLPPVTSTRVVEVVRGLKTTDETVGDVIGMLCNMDRVGVEVFESPGYVTTRLIIPLINEACAVLMESVASAEDIDTAMRLGFGMARGPLETADRVGLDNILLHAERLWREYGDQKYRPSPLLKKMVRAGQLGVETGEGFFKYDAEGNRIKPQLGGSL